MNREFRLYRFDHADGTAKEWAVTYLGNGKAETRWGKAGHLTGTLVVPTAVAMKREQEKERKGYRPIGRVLLDDQGRSPTVGMTVSTAPVPSRPPMAASKAEPIDIAKLLGGGAGFYFD